MRAVLFVMALAAVAAAQPKPKPLPDKLAKAASEAFAKAQAADQNGDLNETIRLYERALAIVEHPYTVFNLADAQRRAKHVDQAIASYTKYLELEPDANDRAAVEKVIHDLESLPATIEVETEESDAIVFVDGKRAGAAPGPFELAGGTHQVDVVTPITFEGMACAVSRGSKRTCNLHGKPRIDGNVVISASWNMTGLNWPVDHQRFQVHGRFVAKPGHYDLKVNDRQCAPLRLDVPAGDDIVTYAYITWPEHVDHASCIPLTIHQQRVKF